MPAGPNVVADVVVDHGSDGALAFQELCPAEVDDRAEQALLVAEVVVERRRGHPGGIADLPRRYITVYGFREERGGGFDDSDLDGWRLAGSGCARSRWGGHAGIVPGFPSVTKGARVALLYGGDRAGRFLRGGNNGRHNDAHGQYRIPGPARPAVEQGVDSGHRARSKPACTRGPEPSRDRGRFPR